MQIKRGSNIFEDANAVYMESSFGAPCEEDFLLLLEGSEDISVINKLYEIQSRELSFRLIKANDDFIEDNKSIAGKRNALDIYDDFKSKGRNIICLLDRDYDFFLGEQRTEEFIKYYDYYELENYIFDEKILKLLINNIYAYSSEEDFFEFLSYFKFIEEACESYILLCYFREINYRKNILDEQQLAKLLAILRLKPMSMMQMNHICSSNKLDKIKIYIENELQNVNLSLEKIKELILENGYNYEQILNKEDNLFYFKYNIKGKTVLSCLETFANYLFEAYPQLKCKKSEGDLSNLSVRLKKEWIPTSCNSLNRLLLEIEELFTTMSA